VLAQTAILQDGKAYQAQGKEPMNLSNVAALAMLDENNRLLTLSFSDILIIAIYFVMVLGIGLYVRRHANTSNDFFMAGREMSAWVST
jgi:SSS family solute:Na+ symporter